MTEAHLLHRKVLAALAKIDSDEPNAPAATAAAWDDIQTFAPVDEVVDALLELERQGLIRSGLVGGGNNEYGISTGVLAITDFGRRRLA